MEILPQPDEPAQHLQFVPVPAGTGVEGELCSPQNPVTHWRAEIIPMGQKKDVQNGQTRTLLPVVTGKAPAWNVHPSLTRRVSNKLTCRWAWTRAGACWEVVVTGQAWRKTWPGRRPSNGSHSHLLVTLSISLALGVQQSQQTLIPTLPSVGKWGGDFISLSHFSGAISREKPNPCLAAEMAHDVVENALRKCRGRNGQNKGYLFW